MDVTGHNETAHEQTEFQSTVNEAFPEVNVNFAPARTPDMLTEGQLVDGLLEAVLSC